MVSGAKQDASPNGACGGVFSFVCKESGDEAPSSSEV
jgi:hypothetical protein